MKKYLLLLAAFGFFFFSSCSDDDDGGETRENSIVATWELTAISPEIPGMNLMACDENPTITFQENGTANWTMYDSENDCTEVTSSGTWEKNEGNNYTVSIPEVGEVDGVVNFAGNDRFTFTTSLPDLPIQVILTFEK